MPVHKGRCHCGDVRVEFATDTDTDRIAVRTCGCTFCQRTRPVYTSDPNGLVTYRHKPGALRTYRFGHESAEFVSCARCGVYLGAVTETSNGLRSVVNVAGALLKELAEKTATPMDFDDEDAETRNARRAKNWTPAQIEEIA